jgi:ATP-dependent DNA helicase DinG
MSDPKPAKIQETIAHPVLIGNAAAAEVLYPDGRQQGLDRAQALALLGQQACIICHATYLIEPLASGHRTDHRDVQSARDMRHFDVCELFAYVMPGVTTTPTPQGLARALGLPVQNTGSQLLADVVEELLGRLTGKFYPHPHEAAEIAIFLARGKWPWAEPVLAAIGHNNPDMKLNEFVTGLNVWDRVEEWQDEGPRPPGSHEPVGIKESRAFLKQVLGEGAEHRASQYDYCDAVTAAFQPRQQKTENHIVLAEAGTGLGKTLGYLAPATLWADRNKAPVWISTYTKNLQRQLEQETHRMIPDPTDRRHKVVIRKGRENYVCLLNMQEAFARMTANNPKTALMAGLVARWARYSRDGDMVGGDFPAWLMSLFFPERVREGRTVTPMSLGLTDRRGECIFAACPHYRKCFIEKTIRAAKKADLVIANHALVMHQAALEQALGPEPTSSDEQGDEPLGMRRLIFDEGHHLFDAADSAFSAHITGFETAELRRWIRGAETRRRRGRSLNDRMAELIDDDEAAEDGLRQIEQAALCLPGPGWQARIEAGMGEGSVEVFLQAVRQQVIARADNRGAGMRLETDCRPMIDELPDIAALLADALIELKRPMTSLANILMKKLDVEAGELDTSERIRIEALARSLRRRSQLMLSGWADMLARLVEKADSNFIEWFAIDYQFGREFDFGMHSHWIDPSFPLAAAVLAPADGIVITSATLKDRPPQAPDDWENAEMRTGAIHLPYSVHRVAHKSPFDYAANAKIIVVNDMGRDNMDHLAAAYRELFLASGGGALGLFTAISRLKAVHRRLVEPLLDKGMPLFAQHVDPIDTGTLVDMFRAEQNACLLGTDAVRDGVDVPGSSLRLIVQDRVPWGQPNILERARRKAFGGAAWQDMIVRLRLRQAFGRLIRRKDDRGIFVILDNRLASRFKTAFPDELEIERMGLVDALDAVKRFTNNN